MYGTRETLCMELERMFTPDEPLTLLVWTEEVVYSYIHEQQPDEDEIREVMKAMGNTPMVDYHRDGLNGENVIYLLARHREMANRQVSVPAALLSRVLTRLESELLQYVGQAWETGCPEPQSLKDAINDVNSLKESLAA